MPSQEEISQQQQLLLTSRRTLGHYINQQAILGSAHMPPGLAHGIREAREHIIRIKNTLRSWGVLVEDLPDDGYSTLLPNSTIERLARQVRLWFETLGYKFESYDIREQNHFEWIIQVPARRKYDRILVRGVAGEAQMSDVLALRHSVDSQQTHEGWLVTARRISQAARDEVAKSQNQDVLFCYNFDELLDQAADFTGYLSWLEAEIKRLSIDQRYVPLACTKEEIDPATKQVIGESRYDSRTGWIEGYIDRWLDDPAKEHISILGEFGTGKTWFSLHYAWIMLQRYQEAKARGVERPRLPLVIPLRDYAKAVSVESLFSEFFFRKHRILLSGYSVFEQLNRMGKLLLIFDGFDEMAARVDRQQMINNFWQLARVVVPGSKAILTCRTEHFPEAKEGRSLLSSELQASTAALTGESPQFEVLELEKFDDDQIRKMLSLQTNSHSIERIMNNSDLLDLARRPVMADLILDALPEIESGKLIDMSRIYLYAIRRKMNRDIKDERTFTSLAEKIYFMCEISWEISSSDRMALNYRLFPERIRRLFGAAVQEQKDLDHWYYDMMGQTMLIRNADGDYTPAHRSLIEFFVAYKFAAELGILDSDFTELAQSQSYLDIDSLPRNYTWSSYFQRERNEEGKVSLIAPLRDFDQEPLQHLSRTFGAQQLSSSILNFMESMSDMDKLWDVLGRMRGCDLDEVMYTGGNVATLLFQKGASFRNVDLHSAVLRGANLYNADLTGANLQGAILQECDLSNCILTSAKLDDSDLTNIIIKEMGSVRSLAWSSDPLYLASGSDDTNIRVWHTQTWEQIAILTSHAATVSALVWSSDGKYLISGSLDGMIVIWDTSNWGIIRARLKLPSPIVSICLPSDIMANRYLYALTLNGDIRVYKSDNFELVARIKNPLSRTTAICISDNERYIIGGNEDGSISIWNRSNGKLLKNIIGKGISVTSMILSANDILTVFKGNLDVEVTLYPYWWQEVDETVFREASDFYTEFMESGLREAVQDNLKEYYEDFEKTFKKELSRNISEESFHALAEKFLFQMQPNYYNELHEWALEEIAEELGDNNFYHYYNTVKRNHGVGFVEIWDLERSARRALKWSVKHRGTAISAASQGLYAIGRFDGTISLWNKDFDIERVRIRAHSGTVNVIAHHPSQEIFASGSDDATIFIWKINYGHEIIGKHAKTLKVQMNCNQASFVGARGLNVKAPNTQDTLREWLLKRGAIL